MRPHIVTGRVIKAMRTMAAFSVIPSQLQGETHFDYLVQDGFHLYNTSIRAGVSTRTSQYRKVARAPRTVWCGAKVTYGQQETHPGTARVISGLCNITIRGSGGLWPSTEPVKLSKSFVTKSSPCIHEYSALTITCQLWPSLTITRQLWPSTLA